jgi:hypothetical protein
MSALEIDMTADYWFWIGAYLMTPVVGVIVGRLYNQPKNGSFFAPIGRERRQFVIGSALVLVLLWPLVLLGFACDPWITSLGYWMDKRKRRFTCKPEHLMEKVSIADAEAAANIIDPLHRVHDVPFGHLNPAWHDFLKKKRLGYSLRKFTIPGKLEERSGAPKWSAPSGRRVGYAWVGLRKVKAEFIYEWDA